MRRRHSIPSNVDPGVGYRAGEQQDRVCGSFRWYGEVRALDAADDNADKGGDDDDDDEMSCFLMGYLFAD